LFGTLGEAFGEQETHAALGDIRVVLSESFLASKKTMTVDFQQAREKAS